MESEGLKAYKEKQRKDFREVSKNAPSVIRNSVGMWLMATIFPLAGAGLVALIIYMDLTEKIDPWLSKTFIVILLMISLFTISKLTRMVRRRNAYILDLEALLNKD
jgi:Na+/melibiose symporter-like transporter